jgi:hypothetical protein
MLHEGLSSCFTEDAKDSSSRSAIPTWYRRNRQLTLCTFQPAVEESVEKHQVGCIIWSNFYANLRTQTPFSTTLSEGA